MTKKKWSNAHSDRNDTKKKVLIKSLQNGGSVFASCEGADISRDTFYNWLKKDKKFEKEYNEAIQSRCIVIEDAMYKNAVTGNVTMQIFLACNLMPEKYKSILKVEHNGTVKTTEVNVNLLDILTKSGGEEIAEKIREAIRAKEKKQ